jgi:DNA gyrase subunit A
MVWGSKRAREMENQSVSGEKIIPRIIEEEMKKSYLEYAMSVIVGRALPDVRDGLKPVHRRILYGMQDLGLQSNKPFKKSARIVGDVMGKYHPHGDSAVYDSLARLTQDFSMRYPLIKGQGNFGSIDGDSPAAMRYTEAKLAKIAEEMLEELEKETVDFVPNFDGSLQEPVVLPSKIPNLLINGSQGIAVGMATSVPPHNLKEVCSALIALIDNPESTIGELMHFIKGPDFPTGSEIAGLQGINQAYTTGKGIITVKAKLLHEEHKGRKSIIVKEIPYQVNKSLLMEDIAELVKDKKISDISDLRDESDRDGIRIVIELKKDANPEIVENLLYNFSKLQSSFSIILLALVDNQPKVLNIKELLEHFLHHRQVVVRRRTAYELKKAEERYHILQGLLIALTHIDAVVDLIKKSKSADEAKKGLMEVYQLTEIQSQAILDMRLQRLAVLEQEKIKLEHKELENTIANLKDILSSEVKILNIIKDEIQEIVQKYGDERKTTISENGEELEIEDMIKNERVVITVTRQGYTKRIPLETYKTQKKGGKGIIGTETKEEDSVEQLFIADTHSYLMVFTNHGQVHWLKVYHIPEASRQAMGKNFVNLCSLDKDEKVTSVIPILAFDDKHHLVMCTKQGLIKKTNLAEYSRPRKGGIIAINLEEGDGLVNVLLTDGTQNILIGTKEGLAVKFDERDVREVGRNSKGVRGVRLNKGDEVIGAVIADDTKNLFTITENGFGKRTLISEYRLISRGGKGVINIQCSERNGKVASLKSVDDEDELVIMSKQGIIIRTQAKTISSIGRNTQGVRLMKLNEGDKVVAAAKIVG